MPSVICVISWLFVIRGVIEKTRVAFFLWDNGIYLLFHAGCRQCRICWVIRPHLVKCDCVVCPLRFPLHQKMADFKEQRVCMKSCFQLGEGGNSHRNLRDVKTCFRRWSSEQNWNIWL